MVQAVFASTSPPQIMKQASTEMPSDAELSAQRAQIDVALANGAIPARNALLQSLVQEVRSETAIRSPHSSVSAVANRR